VFVVFSLVTVLWVVYGYSLAFTEGSSFIGGFDRLFLKGALDAGKGEFAMAATFSKGVVIPEIVFVAFQATFAAITCCLILGAIAERAKFAAVLVFTVLWFTFAYLPIAHMVWFWPGPDGIKDAATLASESAKGGWLWQKGALDFAGGTVVHINAGIAALAAVIVIGRRRGWPQHPMPPHSLPLTLLGTGILWFGWFGFNAGSALGANGLAAQAFVNTNMAAAAAMLGWLLFERLRGGHATTLGAASGAVAGLVAITPCAGYVGGMVPIYIGLIAGAICFFACSIKFKFGYDDALDVVGVHLVGGIVGSLLLGLFADRAFNPAVTHQGVFVNGSWELMGDQVIAVVSTLVWSGVITLVIVKVLDLVIPGGIRVSDEDEETGLDLTQHSEVGYALERV
jgi:Amt family ammonium transporter